MPWWHNEEEVDDVPAALQCAAAHCSFGKAGNAIVRLEIEGSL